MTTDDNKTIFNYLRKLVPQIPESTTRLTLDIAIDCTPIIKCEFIPQPMALNKDGIITKKLRIEMIEDDAS